MFREQTETCSENRNKPRNLEKIAVGALGGEEAPIDPGVNHGSLFGRQEESRRALAGQSVPSDCATTTHCAERRSVCTFGASRRACWSGCHGGHAGLVRQNVRRGSGQIRRGADVQGTGDGRPIPATSMRHIKKAPIPTTPTVPSAANLRRSQPRATRRTARNMSSSSTRTGLSTRWSLTTRATFQR